MNEFEEILTLSHHAYFIHHKQGIVDRLKDFLHKKFKIQQKQNPDFFHENYITLSIEQSRRIKEIHTGKSFAENGKRIFIIEVNAITHEAQNSLLKIFEEPNETSLFFLIMPSVEILLPTLKSRLFIIKNNNHDEIPDFIKQAKDFIKMNIGEKISFVNELAKDISDEKKTKMDAITFLSALEKVIYDKVDFNNISIEEKQSLNAILKARDYMNDRSPSIKQILEFVAVSL
jgi:DNA polymerase III delta prime subunit